MKGMKGTILLVTMLAMLAALGCSKRQEVAAEGKPAPDFTLKDLSGNPVTLSSLKGKVVLVNFWATWCPPCREEVPSLVRMNQALQGKPFQLLAISIDEGGKKAVQEFFQKSGQVLPAFLDSDGAVAKRYGTTGVPETFVVDAKGIIVKKVVGAMDWSDPKVLNALVELGKEK